MRITWKGTASFVIETAQERILIDPFLSLRGGTNPARFEDFLEYDAILITHGHFDHLYFVPELIDEGDATVFCTRVPADTLERYTENTGNIALIRPGMDLQFSDISIHVYRGKHIEFDRRYIPDTLSPRRVLRYIRNMPFLIWANKAFQEGGQIVAFEIRAEEKKILLLGSLNLLEEETYPEQPDLLILPYQGNNDLVEHADRILERIRPKAVLLSHFDNAFPPESRDVDLRPLKRLLTQKYPQIRCVKPAAGKPVSF